MRHAEAKLLTAFVKSVPADGTIISAVVSTSSIDRDQEIMLATGFDELLHIYKSNPVLLFQHPWQYDEKPVVQDNLGHAVDFRTIPDTDDGGGSFEIDFDYAADINPSAKMCLEMVRRGDMRAYSIGFFSRHSVTRSSSKQEMDALPRFAREALLSGACKRVHTQVELFEVSQVQVGSNRESLAAFRALRLALTEEADMPEEEVPAPDMEGKTPGGEKARAKMGHAPTNDIVARLNGAINSLSAYYSFYDDEHETKLPPDAKTCADVADILDRVSADLRALAPAAPIASSIPEADADKKSADGPPVEHDVIGRMVSEAMAKYSQPAA